MILCVTQRPRRDSVASHVPLIDAIWLECGGARTVAAFEVEHTTSIYSGIMRMLDLASGAPQATWAVPRRARF